MTTYIALFNLTDAGIKGAKDSPRRLDAAKKLLADMGGDEAVLHGDGRVRLWSYRPNGGSLTTRQAQRNFGGA